MLNQVNTRAGLALIVILAGPGALAAAPATTPGSPPVLLDRNGSLVAVESYAPNILRVTLGTDKDTVLEPPGFGISATADARGWKHQATASGDQFSSAVFSLQVHAQPYPGPPSQMERYFAPSLPPLTLTVRAPGGDRILEMSGWEMAPHTVNGEKTFRVGATFLAPADEHYYGLGQNQEGQLDYRGRTIDCKHYYDAPTGETVCVPFLVTNKGYGIVWDNPSDTLVSAGIHGHTTWKSNVGERVSFFVIVGSTTDELYAGYRRLTGITPLPPKAAFGYLQSKARYESQQQVLAVADGYRSRGYPLNVIVVDWFYWTRMGQLDIDPGAFPDPQAMNQQLHAQGVHSIISVWPRFERESRYFDFLAAKGWLLKDRDGKPVDGLAERSDRAGALIDSTNPQAREWYRDIFGTTSRPRASIGSVGRDRAGPGPRRRFLLPSARAIAITTSFRYSIPKVLPMAHAVTGPTNAISSWRAPPI